jgi:hypothetical protein
MCKLSNEKNKLLSFTKRQTYGTRRQQATLINSFAIPMNRILVTRRTHKPRVLAANINTLNYMAI